MPHGLREQGFIDIQLLKLPLLTNYIRINSAKGNTPILSVALQQPTERRWSLPLWDKDRNSSQGQITYFSLVPLPIIRTRTIIDHSSI